jgi:hypothetical protein
MKWTMCIPTNIKLRSTINNFYCIEGEGFPPVALMETESIKVNEPDLSLQPGESLEPFFFPTQPNYDEVTGQRQYALGLQGIESTYYANRQGSGNPLRYSHIYAGIIAQGARTNQGDNSILVENMNLWVPLNAQGYLIRRALKNGHL